MLAKKRVMGVSKSASFDLGLIFVGGNVWIVSGLGVGRLYLVCG